MLDEDNMVDEYLTHIIAHPKTFPYIIVPQAISIPSSLLNSLLKPPCLSTSLKSQKTLLQVYFIIFSSARLFSEVSNTVLYIFPVFTF